MRRFFILFARLTVFENHRKSLIQHYERSELRLYFEWTKVNQKCQKWSNLASFLKTWSLQSNSVTRQVNLRGQKLVENTIFFFVYRNVLNLILNRGLWSEKHFQFLFIFSSNFPPPWFSTIHRCLFCSRT